MNLPLLHEPPPQYPALSREFYGNKQQVKPFKIFTFSICLIVIFNLFYYLYIDQFDSYRENRKFTLVDQLDKPVDVIILGDSVANFGIDPDRIEAETGLTALNLALNGSWTYYHDVWILEYYIDKFGPPDYLLWGHTYHIVGRNFNPQVRLTSSASPYGFTWFSDYLHPVVSDADVLEIIIKRLLPLVYRSTTTQEIVSDLLALQNPIHNDRHTENGFFGIEPIDIHAVEKTAQNDANQLSGRIFMQEDNKRIINILLDMIEEYQISTYAYITPVHQIIGNQDKYAFALIPQSNWFWKRGERMEYFDFNPEIITYDTEHMIDGDHVNVIGAQLYTQYLIDWIWGDYVPATYDDVMSQVIN